MARLLAVFAVLAVAGARADFIGALHNVHDAEEALAALKADARADGDYAALKKANALGKRMEAMESKIHDLEREGNLEREDDAAPADLESVSERFNAIKAKIQRNPELRSDKAIQSKLARISGKFERVEGAEEEKAEEEAAPADLESVSERFDAIKAKIQRNPELRSDKAIQSKLARISGKFERLEGAEEEKAEEEAAPADLESVSERFDAIKAKIQRNPELRSDKAIHSKLARISGKFERLEGAKEEKAEEEAAPADLESLSGRFGAIEAEIRADKELRFDKAIQAKLPRISSKFERLAGDSEDDDDETPRRKGSGDAENEEAEEGEEDEEDKKDEDTEDEPSNALVPNGLDQPEVLERVQKRFEAIKAKIAKSKLASNPTIKASLRRIGRKFKDMEM